MPKKPSILEVKQKHELKLLQMDGIEGIGISEEKGKEVLVIYCSKNPKYLTPNLPDDLEGFPLVYKKTSTFSAF